jgi:hypothetical protein
LRIRLSDAATSADLKGVPSWNRTFGRRVSVSVCESLENFHLVARPGTMSRFELSWTSVP